MAIDSKFNEVQCPAPAGSHTLTLQANESGGFTIKANGYRIAEMEFGGGRFRLHLPGSLPANDSGTDIGAVVDGTGHLAVNY